jgi:hypothetical protein
MTISKREIEELRQFFGGYFHQDWDLAGSTPSDVMAAFLQNASSESLRNLADALRRLLEDFSTEAALQTYLVDELWCEYVPADGGTTRWIKSLSTEIDAELQRRGV